jgi:hypothetical protein
MAAVPTGPSTSETIEIDLAGKYRVRVGSGVDVGPDRSSPQKIGR